MSQQRKKNTKIYCGDDDILPENYDKMGTRFKCLQKGFGTGLILERKAKQDGKTKAIKRTPKKSPKLYCGDKHILPDGYDIKGTRYQCLKRGIGVGIYNESRRDSKNELKDYKEMKEGKSDDYKKFGSNKKSIKKRSTKKRSTKKRSSKKRSTKKKSSKKKSIKKSKKRSKRSTKKSKKRSKRSTKKSKKRSNKKSIKKKIKKTKISTYNSYVKNNYTRVKNKYKLKDSEDVFIKLAKLWKKN
jgi:hypothetical protein